MQITRNGGVGVPNLAEGDGEWDRGIAGVLESYDPAAATAGVGGEVGEVGEPRRSTGGGADELPGPEATEEGRGGVPPCRHLRERERGVARTERGQEMAGRLRAGGV
jgi:hypothetical protein